MTDAIPWLPPIVKESINICTVNINNIYIVHYKTVKLCMLSHGKQRILINNKSIFLQYVATEHV